MRVKESGVRIELSPLEARALHRELGELRRHAGPQLYIPDVGHLDTLNGVFWALDSADLGED